MKKGMVLSKVGEMDLAGSLKAYARAGFDGVEVRMSEEGDEFTLSPWSTEDEVRRFGEEVRRAGLEVPSVMGGLHWKYPLTSPDPKVADRCKESIRLTLKVARHLGAEVGEPFPEAVEEGVVTPGDEDEQPGRLGQAARSPVELCRIEQPEFSLGEGPEELADRAGIGPRPADEDGGHEPAPGRGRRGVHRRAPAPASRRFRAARIDLTGIPAPSASPAPPGASAGSPSYKFGLWK